MILKTVAASMCLSALTNVTPIPATSFDASGLVYEATHDFNLNPVATQSGTRVRETAAGKPLHLVEGDALILEDTQMDARGESLTRFAIDEADPNAPSTYWVRTKDLRNADLAISVQTDEQLFTPIPSLTAPDQRYETTLEARRYGRFQARRRHAGNFCMSHPTHPYCCKSAVNYMLLRKHLIHTRVTGIPAYRMADGLARQNWKEVHCGARQHPTVGMTCTYRGGHNGHTEAWNGHCWYYGARCSRTPMNQSNRQCFSCKVPRR